jgi:hypothetical protein
MRARVLDGSPRRVGEECDDPTRRDRSRDGFDCSFQRMFRHLDATTARGGEQRGELLGAV